MASTARLETTLSRRRPARTDGVIGIVRQLVQDLFDPYRPELHYMRGPGPKWHAKHARVSADPVDSPGLRRATI